MTAMSVDLLVLVSGIVLFGGLVKGIAGFGYAIASTALLATVLSPSTAVVLMILPMLVANLTLLRELDLNGLTRCVERFWPFGLTAMGGTAVGMLLLDAVPASVLTLGLGAFTLLYVAGKQPWVRLPGEASARAYCFTTGAGPQALIGLVSGVIFGVANVAVQVVAYFDSLDLDRSTFVGVLAMMLVGISMLRIGMAWGLGLYAAGPLLVSSAIVSVPGLAGVELGRRARRFIPDRYEQAGVLVLLTVIGVRLLAKGL